MGIAHRRADIGMSRQVFHRHDVYAASCEPGSKRIAEHVPGYLAQSRTFHGCDQCALDILVAVTGHRAVENIWPVLVAQSRFDDPESGIVERDA